MLNNITLHTNNSFGKMMDVFAQKNPEFFKGMKYNIPEKAVKIVNVEIDRGEMLVFFDTNTWDVKDGLIYNDEGFLNELRAALAEVGFNDEIDYSEQGMQGKDFVSLDIL
jgi:hypothetical protein